MGRHSPLGRTCNSVARWSRATRSWEAEHLLGQDGALDLVGPSPDGGRLVIEPRPLPLAVTRRVGRTLPQRCRLAENRHGGVVQPLAHLAPVEFERAALRPRVEPLGQSADAAEVVELEEPDLDVGPVSYTHLRAHETVL